MPRVASVAALLPDTQADLAQLDALASSNGFTLGIADYGGVRTAGDTTAILGYRVADYTKAVQQNPAVASISIDNWRPIAAYGKSYHDYGAAVDVAINGMPAGMSYAQAVAQVQGLAAQAGFNVPLPSTDPLHFELPITLAQAASDWAIYQAGGDPSSEGSADDGTDDSSETSDQPASSGVSDGVLIGGVAAVLLGIVLLPQVFP